MNYVYGAAAIAMMMALLLPIIFKIKEISLIVVVAIGLVMMLIDMWQDVRDSGDRPDSH